MGDKKGKEKLTRRDFLGTSLKVSAGAAAASVASKFIGRSDRYSPYSILAGGDKGTDFKPKEGLAPGMIGGPTGFEGAERFQYGPDEAAGRAVEALRKMRADGNAPKELVVMLPPGAVGHWESPFPEGAPPAKEVFKEETGIEIIPVDVVETEQTTKLIQDYQTGAQSYDTYSFWSADLADIAASGALAELDEWMDKYKPDWLDPEWGFVGGEVSFSATSQVFGKTYNVNMDGDYQIWVYRKDLFEDPGEQRAFKDRYGWDLQWPETWEQMDQISEFFTRPDQGMLGNTSLRNQYWGFTNFYQRYTSFGNPARYYFDAETAKPLINSPEGFQACKEYVETMKYHHKDGISWGWPEQYANMAAGKAAITCAFPNMPKFLDNPDNPDSQIVGKIRTGLAPGRVINGKLVRRSVWWPNIGHAVAAGGKNPEASYLFLQWASSGKVCTWLTGNPAGYYDPWRIPHFSDPVVVKSYHEYHIPVYVSSIENASPPINIPGVTEYVTAMDQNLQEALTGRKSPEQAMRDTAAAWEKITNQKGREKQIQALKAARAAWPKEVGTPTIKS
jgi:multiple sugar transport system substrate-binding protein